MKLQRHLFEEEIKQPAQALIAKLNAISSKKDSKKDDDTDNQARLDYLQSQKIAVLNYAYLLITCGLLESKEICIRSCALLRVMAMNPDADAILKSKPVVLAQVDKWIQALPVKPIHINREQKYQAHLKLDQTLQAVGKYLGNLLPKDQDKIKILLKNLIENPVEKPSIGQLIRMLTALEQDLSIIRDCVSHHHQQEGFLNFLGRYQPQNKLVTDLNNKIKEISTLNQSKKEQDFFNLTDLPTVLFGYASVFIDDRDLSHLAIINKRHYNLFKTEPMLQHQLLLAKFLHHIAWGQRNAAEKMLIAEKAELKEEQESRLLTQKGSVVDKAGQGFYLTGLQLSFFYLDTHARNMMVRYLSENEIRKQLEDYEKLGANATPYGKHDVCSYYIEALQACLDYANAPNRNYEKARALWMKVGLAQWRCAMHVIHELLRQDRSFYPCPKFNEKTLPESNSFTYVEYDASSGDTSMKKMILTFKSHSGLSIIFSIIRGAGTPAWVLKVESNDLRLGLDLAAIRQLFKVRLSEYQSLKQQFLKDYGQNFTSSQNYSK